MREIKRGDRQERKEEEEMTSEENKMEDGDRGREN